MAALAGCGDNGTGGADLAVGPDMTSTCRHTVPCTDQSVQQLPLYTQANAATVDNQSAAGVFTTTIDASAGGVTPTKSYVYLKFTDQGLTRVDLGDEAALASMDWDLAARRFILRTNSGVSGPSCVTASRTATATQFDTLAAVPANLDLRVEEYFTASCDYVPDGSGLMSPGTALQSFWEYPGCVKMTGNVFVLALADGRHVKMQVTSYYTPSVQTTCDTTGMAPTPSGAGHLVLKWAFLP